MYDFDCSLENEIYIYIYIYIYKHETYNRAMGIPETSSKQ